MLPLIFSKSEGLNILCLGAHCDDIEIGCGGTMLRLIKENANLNIKWVVFTSNEQREKEARSSANSFLKEVARHEIIIKGFKDGFMPQYAAEIKTYFEELKEKFQPDVIFTHYRHDLHQDHRIVCDLTWNTFRNHFILEYEIPKYDGDFGNPAFYVSLNVENATQKVHLIRNNFTSQREKHWFDEDLFYALMRIRGMESVAKTKYAEAFYIRKCLI